MKNQYSWRDGWALTYPHAVATKPKVTQPEPITRCLSCGAWLIIKQACNTCGMESK